MGSDFEDAFDGLRDATTGGGSALTDAVLDRLTGYKEFAEKYSGASFGGGVYRVHNAESGHLGRSLLDEAFPVLRGRAIPFGYDWLGRQFAVDVERVNGGEPQVLLVDPGAGEALEIPATFESFHNFELVKYGEAALALSFFEDWKVAVADGRPLARDECVGYITPLFLGGLDSVGNLERTDFEVYWALSAQLIAVSRGLPPGSGISQVRS